MSEIIETGSRRRRSRTERPRAEALGEKRQIDRTKDELELGRFTGDKARRPASDNAASSAPSEISEVVGPRRENAYDQLKADAAHAEEEVDIAGPLKVDDDAMPSRPRAKRRSRNPTIDDAASGIARLATLGLLAAFGVVLISLTAAVFMVMPRYDFLGDPLITDPAFADGLIDWDQAGLISADGDDPSTIVLESINAESGTYLTRDIQLPAGETKLVLQARVQGDQVVPGPEDWDGARIYLAELGTDGEPDWSRDHTLFKLDGSTGVRNYEKLFTIPAAIETARLSLEMKNATGRLTVSHLELRLVEYKITFLIAAGILLVCWAALVILAGIKGFASIESPKIRIWLGVFGALAVVGLMLPGNIREIGAISIADWIGTDEYGVDTIGHGVIFTILPFLVRLGRPKDPLWLQIGVWALIAVASEMLQLFTIGRDPSLDDLWVDGLGILLGLGLAEIARRVQHFRAA